MKRFVVDASVAIKWYLPETLTEHADQFLEEAAKTGAKLLAPDLIIAEVGNILWKKYRLGELSLQEARQALVQVRDFMPMQIHPTISLLESAWEIARAYERSVYDALYIALADQHDAILITADQRLVNALRRAPLGKRIQWLGHWA